LIGAAIFGIGWGWAGICPGPGVLCFYFYIPQTIVFIFMVVCGQLFENKIDKKIENLFNRNNNNEEVTVKIEEDDLSVGVRISRFKESQIESNEPKEIKINNK
jgi:hypothetical protein